MATQKHKQATPVFICRICASPLFMGIADLVTTDPDTLGGTTVFKGTRVPTKTLFEYLENNYSLNEFLECFPSVSREAACSLLTLWQTANLIPGLSQP